MKTFNEKTPSGSKTASLKRKASKVGEESHKKTRTVDEEEEDSTSREVSNLLKPLLEQMKLVIDVFRLYEEETWYKELSARYQLLPSLSNLVTSRAELSSRAELKAWTLPPDLDKQEYELLREKLNDLEKLRIKAIDRSQELPAPSTYCLGASYRRAKTNSMMAVRDGRRDRPPVALELLHISFRTFTYWSFVDPLPLPGSPTYSTESRLIKDKKAFINVYQVANQLLVSMPQLYESHDDRLHEFKKALLLIFPEDATHEWCTNVSVCQKVSGSGGVPTYKVDITYRTKQSHIALIFVEVKLELGEGGNPFWQNHRLYQSYAKENLNSRQNGAPVFLVQLCGMTLLDYDIHISYYYHQEHILG